MVLFKAIKGIGKAVFGGGGGRKRGGGMRVNMDKAKKFRRAQGRKRGGGPAIKKLKKHYSKA